MPYGTPQGPGQSRYQISANSVDKVGDYTVAFSVAVSTDNIDAPEVPAIVQKFVDMIGAASSFTLASASRTNAYTEAITPTP